MTPSEYLPSLSEGIKDRAEVLGGDSGTSVADTNFHTPLLRTGENGDLPLLGKFDCVPDQILDNHFELSHISEQNRKSWLGLPFKLQLTLFTEVTRFGL